MLTRFVLYILVGLCSVGSVSCKNQSSIAYGVTERDANEIIVLLAGRGIAAEKKGTVASGAGGNSDKTWDIMVSSSKVTESLAILNQAGLPRLRGTSLLDLFGSQGLVPSDLQDRIRYQEGLSEQLAKTIRKMDGIVDADVQVSFPKEEENIPMTASIYVRHSGILDNPNSLTVSKIKRLVASAVPGLTPDNVSVVSDKAVRYDYYPAEKESSIVSVWGMAIEKHSVPLFRFVFYVLILVLLISGLAISFFAWKFYYVIQLSLKKGLKQFFTLEQINPAQVKGLQSSSTEKEAAPVVNSKEEDHEDKL